MTALAFTCVINPIKIRAPERNWVENTPSEFKQIINGNLNAFSKN